MARRNQRSRDVGGGCYFLRCEQNSEPRLQHERFDAEIQQAEFLEPIEPRRSVATREPALR